MRRRRHVIVLDTGVDAGDFPPGYRFFSGAHGVRWSDAPAATGAGVGGGHVTTIDVPGTAARFLRVVQTATAPQWWSVADLRVYR